MNSIDEKLVKFIEENITKGNYIQSNIQSLEETDDEYFIFKQRDNGKSYSILAKANIEMPKDIVIPSQYDNKSIVSIGANAFSDRKNKTIKNHNIETVTIPQTIIDISDEAFKDCTNLRKVTINGDRVPELGEDVFKNTSEDLVIIVPSEMVDKYKKDEDWSIYKDNISDIDPDNSPEKGVNQDGIVNTIVTTIVDSQDVSVTHNFYFFNVNNSSTDKSTDMDE